MMDEKRVKEILRNLPHPPRLSIPPPQDYSGFPRKKITISRAQYDPSSIPFKLSHSLMILEDAGNVKEQFNQTLWQELAAAALQHYHETQGIKMELFGEAYASLVFKAYKCCFHLNFQAKPDDSIESSPKLIFAEVLRCLKSEVVRVTFCGIIDPSNPELLKGCRYCCSMKVLHPPGVEFFKVDKAFGSAINVHTPVDWKSRKKMDEKRTREILRNLPHPPRLSIPPPQDYSGFPRRKITISRAQYDPSSLPFKLSHSLMILKDAGNVEEQFNQTLWQELAAAALQHYHETQGIKMELFGEAYASLVFKAYKCCFHLNFQAKPDDSIESSPKLIFAEVLRCLKSEVVRVTFCGIIDPSNPELLKGCRYCCSMKVLHPPGVEFFKVDKAFGSGATIS